MATTTIPEQRGNPESERSQRRLALLRQARARRASARRAAMLRTAVLLRASGYRDGR